MTLNDLLSDILGRLEENTQTGFPIFWSQTYEILPALVDAMFEASLITGTVQAHDIQVTLAAGTHYFSLQNNTAIGVPAGVVAALRLKAPYPVRKVTLQSLDATVPGWQSAAPLPPETRGSSIISWFPLGVSAFGIYPALAVDSFVTMDFIVSPTTTPRPYTASIPVPLQSEFGDLLPMYAAVICRAKELGSDAEEASTVMDEYMQAVKQLSLFQSRLDQLILTKAYGAKMQVNVRQVV
jgi:hypothetical protein